MSYNDLRKGRFSETGREYFLTVVVQNREPVFKDLYLTRKLIRVMREIQDEELGVWQSWVVMPDHIHALVSLELSPLSEFVKVFKGRSARAINDCLDRSGSFWQPGFYDRALRKEEDRKVIARYIVANPLRAGLVEDVRDYPHWDAVWL